MRTPRMETKDAIDHEIYDRVVWDGKDSLEFFHVPCGKDGKTQHDTNIYLKNQLPNGCGFSCGGLCIYVPEKQREKARVILEDAYLELQYGSRIMHTINPAHLALWESFDKRGQDDYGGNIWSAVQFTIPWEIEPNMNIRAELRWPEMHIARSDGMAFMLKLQGYLYRPKF